MTLPAAIRVNVNANFPSLVYATSPITIAKANGIWSIGFTISAFASQVPPSGNFPTDYLLGWDDIAKTYFKISITNLNAAITPIGTARTQRFTTNTPIVVAGTDQIISMRITSAAACVLPAAATRLGVPLTFKDLGQATAHNITFTGNGGETIDGQASYVISDNYGWVTFVPFNDGTNSGWMVQ
jgi:hypothetical protein